VQYQKKKPEFKFDVWIFHHEWIRRQGVSSSPHFTIHDIAPVTITITTFSHNHQIPWYFHPCSAWARMKGI
jgi:hypothetical protein